jgi:hypothetical protein
VPIGAGSLGDFSHVGRGQCPDRDSAVFTIKESGDAGLHRRGKKPRGQGPGLYRIGSQLRRHPL